MKRLAIIAHDNKKVDRETLAGFALIATRHTARLLERKISLPVEELLSGPEGGDTRIAARVVCNVHNVPLATNVATADLIITSFVRLDELHGAPELILERNDRVI